MKLYLFLIVMMLSEMLTDTYQGFDGRNPITSLRILQAKTTSQRELVNKLLCADDMAKIPQ